MALRDQQISDFPLCNKSFNLSYCGHDLCRSRWHRCLEFSRSGCVKGTARSPFPRACPSFPIDFAVCRSSTRRSAPTVARFAPTPARPTRSCATTSRCGSTWAAACSAPNARPPARPAISFVRHVVVNLGPSHAGLRRAPQRHLRSVVQQQQGEPAVRYVALRRETPSLPQLDNRPLELVHRRCQRTTPASTDLIRRIHLSAEGGGASSHSPNP